jgi:hypothetical protein
MEMSQETIEMINEFKIQQRTAETVRVEERGPKMTKRQRNEAKRQLTAARADDILKYARERGLKVTTGHGNHGVHIEAENGLSRPVPVHGRGKSLGLGLTKSLQTFIDQAYIGISGQNARAELSL